MNFARLKSQITYDYVAKLLTTIGIGDTDIPDRIAENIAIELSRLAKHFQITSATIERVSEDWRVIVRVSVEHVVRNQSSIGEAKGSMKLAYGSWIMSRNQRAEEHRFQSTMVIVRAAVVYRDEFIMHCD